jgi:hypothetical protein
LVGDMPQSVDEATQRERRAEIGVEEIGVMGGWGIATLGAKREIG